MLWYHIATRCAGPSSLGALTMSFEGGAFPLGKKAGTAAPSLSQQLCECDFLFARYLSPRRSRAFPWSEKVSENDWKALIAQAVEMTQPWLRAWRVSVAVQVGLIEKPPTHGSKLLSALVNSILYIAERGGKDSRVDIALWAHDEEVMISVCGANGRPLSVPWTLQQMGPAVPRIAVASSAMAEFGGQLTVSEHPNRVLLILPAPCPVTSTRVQQVSESTKTVL